MTRTYTQREGEREGERVYVRHTPPNPARGGSLERRICFTYAFEVEFPNVVLSRENERARMTLLGAPPRALGVVFLSFSLSLSLSSLPQGGSFSYKLLQHRETCTCEACTPGRLFNYSSLFCCKKILNCL